MSLRNVNGPPSDERTDAPMNAPDETPDSSRQKQGFSPAKVLVLIGVALAASVIYFQFGDELNLESLAQRETQLKAWKSDHPVLVYAVAAAIYVTITGLSLPGALVLSLTYAWYFGFVPGVIVVSFSSTAGATVAFLLSRYILRDTVQARFGDRLQQVNAAFEREGAFYLFAMRLITAIPFFTINLVMGLTPIRVTTYWWVSQLGMLPGTLVYVYFGSRVPDLATLSEKGTSEIPVMELLIGLSLLGVFPIVVKKLVEKFRPVDTSDDTSTTA